MQLGDFLVAYLKKIGVSHLFGIPGDLVISLFLKFGRPQGLKIITLSHEPGVGFAADGYARSTGRIGAICVKEIESQFHIYREVTCAAKIIKDPARAAIEIDEVIRAIWMNQQPGYLEI